MINGEQTQGRPQLVPGQWCMGRLTVERWCAELLEPKPEEGGKQI